MKADSAFFILPLMDTDFIFDEFISFDEKLNRVLEYQLQNESVYAGFMRELQQHTELEFDKENVPLLPIEAFKRAKIFSGKQVELEFKSSGTSGMERSTHYVASSAIYRKSILQGMSRVFNLDDFVVLGYTPGYADNPNSSLIWMINELIQHSRSELSGFIQLDKPFPAERIEKIHSTGKKIMLFGAAFGLIDIIEKQSIPLPQDSVLIETGGMKTYRREMNRDEMYKLLTKGFNLKLDNIYSEYGMTELLSQAWAKGNGLFSCPPWMYISIRNPEDPLSKMPEGDPGLIGVIDLANIFSCSFILTGDKGRKIGDSFTVEGRYHAENLRGCNFLIDAD